jgi:hypothetical protein
MQDFKDRLTDMDQLPGDKTGKVCVLPQFKLIRRARHSDAFRRHAVFATHP